MKSSEAPWKRKLTTSITPQRSQLIHLNRPDRRGCAGRSKRTSRRLEPVRPAHVPGQRLRATAIPPAGSKLPATKLLAAQLLAAHLPLPGPKLPRAFLPQVPRSIVGTPHPIRQLLPQANLQQATILCAAT